VPGVSASSRFFDVMAVMESDLKDLECQEVSHGGHGAHEDMHVLAFGQ